MSIASNLQHFGVTQVLVTLKDRGAGDRRSPDRGRTASLLKLFRATSDSRAGAVAQAFHVAPVSARHYPNLGVLLGTIDGEAYQRLKRDPRVASIHEAPEISLIRPVKMESSEAEKGTTWGIRRLSVDRLWQAGWTGKGIIVGHLDTGVDGRHPALVEAIHAFARFDWMGNIVPDAEAEDSDDHGTHTAGTIAGREFRGSRFGVAPGASLASAMVIEGGDAIARILGGMDWIVGLGARILSMSLGLRGYREDLLPLMKILRERGILPVIAVGNEGPGTSRSPGNYDVVLSVGACDVDDRVPAFSSSQRFVRPADPFVPDLVAPGAEVLSSLPGGKVGKLSGTSMATPHIAGLAALLMEAAPNASIEAIERAILDSCQRPDTMPESRASRGVPDALRALQFLRSDEPTSPPPPKPPAKKKSPKKKKKGEPSELRRSLTKKSHRPKGTSKRPASRKPAIPKKTKSMERNV